MSTAPSSSNISVGMAAKFFRLLEVTPAQIRNVVDNPEFRDEVTELLRRGPERPDYPMLTSLHYDAARRLITDMGRDSSDGLDRLLEALNKLPGRERDVLRLYYGLDTGVAMSYRQVGNIHGIGGSRAGSIARRAINRLRHS